MAGKSGKRSISDEERKEIREAFQILDEDGDGRLSLDDMKTLLQSQFMVFTDSQVTAVVKELDEDDSGFIEYKEFEKYVIENNLSKPTVEEFGAEMKEAFQMFDTDKNGYIDANEFKSFMTTLGDKMTDQEVMDMMKEADTNGDGQIDYLVQTIGRTSGVARAGVTRCGPHALATPLGRSRRSHSLSKHLSTVHSSF